MVYGQAVEGFPKEIAEQIAQLPGDRRVRVVVEEAQNGALLLPPLTKEEFEREMAALDAMAVSVVHFVDDSREAIYTRQDGE